MTLSYLKSRKLCMDYDFKTQFAVYFYCHSYLVMAVSGLVVPVWLILAKRYTIIRENFWSGYDE